MNKQEWKLEYQKWRSFFRLNFPATVNSYKKHHNVGHTFANNIQCETIRNMAPNGIYYALFNRDYTSRVRAITEGKYGIRCNMDLSPYQIEQHRLKAKGIALDWTLCHKTRLARFSKC